MTTGRINQVTTVDEGATVAGARLDFFLPRPEPLFPFSFLTSLAGLTRRRPSRKRSSVPDATLRRGGTRRLGRPASANRLRLRSPTFREAAQPPFFSRRARRGAAGERRQLPSAPPLSRPLCVGGQARGRAVTAGSTRASCTPAGRPDLVSLSPTRAMKSGDGCTAQTATHADPS